MRHTGRATIKMQTLGVEAWSGEGGRGGEEGKGGGRGEGRR